MSSRPALLILASWLSVAWGAVAAEPVFPSPIPHATVSQWLGVTNITINYFSPAVGGRRLWGNVIKPDEAWLMGEGAAPVVTFSRDVVLGGAAISAGTYALLAIPSAGDWTVVVNRQNRLWRAADRDPALDVARVKVTMEAAPPRERLTFLFSDFTDEKATLNFEWDKISLRLPIALHTDEQIRAEMQALDGTWRSYADAARYFLEKKNDIAGGLVYVNRSLVLRESWYNLWIKALLLAAKADYPNAQATAERACQLGRAAGEEFTLEPTIRETLAAWRSRSGEPQSPERLAQPPRSGRTPRSQRRPASVANPSSAPVDMTIAGGDQADEPTPVPLERPVDLGRAPIAKPPDASAFAPVIKRGRRDLQRCYQRALRQDPTLSTARVTVSINVGTSGRVTKVAFQPSLPTGEFDACLQSSIARWRFPPSPAEYETQVPLVLNGRL